MDFILQKALASLTGPDLNEARLHVHAREYRLQKAHRS